MKCEYCQVEMKANYGSGRFCNVKCAKSFSTSKNRTEISEKVSATLKKPMHQINCLTCGALVIGKRKKIKYCDRKCSANDPKIKMQRNENLSKTLKEKFSTDVNARDRMRKIGRKGGFGTRCETDSGISCDSMFEKKAFEILEEYKLEFIPHKILPASSRISDAYLPSLNIWLEFDGINREKCYTDKSSPRWLQWEGKLNEYKNKQLNVKVFVSHNEIEKFCKEL